MADIVDQVSTAVVPATLPANEKAALIRRRAREAIENASLATVRASMPNYVDVVENMLAKADVNNPLSLSQIGDWALAGLADAALEVLTAVQRRPNQDALFELREFEKKLDDHLKPFKDRLAQEQKGKEPEKSPVPVVGSLIDAVGDGAARISGAVSEVAGQIARFTKSEARRRQELRQRLQGEITTLNAINAELEGAVTKIATDAKAVKTKIVEHRELPQIIQDQVMRTMDMHGEALEGIFLSLVVVNEKARDLQENVIPRLEEDTGQLVDFDADALQRSKAALGFLGERRTDLMAAFLDTYVQKYMLYEMLGINTASATETARLESIALPQMIRNIGVMALQQRIAEHIAANASANQLLAESTLSVAGGFARVVELSKRGDEIKLSAARATITAADTMLTAIGQLREHEARYIIDNRTVQSEIAQSIGNLRAAAARIGAPQAKTEKPSPTELGAARELARTITGVAPRGAKDVVAQEPLPAAAPAPETEILPPTRAADGDFAGMFRTARQAKRQP